MTRILVVNAGSSSLKTSVIEVGRVDPLASAKVDWGSDATRVVDRAAGLENALSLISSTGIRPADLEGAAHRVVHGGVHFRQPTIVDDDALVELDRLSVLAPLHNTIAVETLHAQQTLLPDLPAVAVFDTAFHASLPEEAYIYPLPWSWYSEWGVRRFGFHGLSVAWSVRRSADLLGRPAEDLSLVVAHLGSGCSVTAVVGGRSASNSMGMTPLEGLAMGTRSGTIDPGVILFAQREYGMDFDELGRVLDHESGLYGVSGLTGDVRTLIEAAEAGHHRAQLALDIFVRRAAQEIAAAASSLERLDALVFTAGIGENAAGIRTAICARLKVLGVPAVGPDRVDSDAVLAGGGETVAVLRIEAREDVIMADAAAAALGR